MSYTDAQNCDYLATVSLIRMQLVIHKFWLKRHMRCSLTISCLMSMEL